VDLLRDVNSLLNDRVGASLTAVDCGDIINLIGRCVVAGNLRRSAEILIGSPDDLGFISMKQNKEKLFSHRWASNNSIAIDNDFDDFDRIAQGIISNGEPGIVNLELARTRLRLIDEFGDERNLAVDGTNPCGEIVLASGECCNLADIFPAHVEAKGYDMERILKLALRYTKRVTCSQFEWPATRALVARNRRLGISISGIRDWMVMRKVSNLEELAGELDAWYKILRREDREYSHALGIPESVALTTVKPSGTTAIMPGASPGLHAHWARYFIRRIRFQEHDPLVDIVRQCGIPVEADVYSPNTVVAEFPIKAPRAESRYFRASSDLSLEEQFQTQATLQRWWSDNSVSATLTFKKDERRRIPHLLREYQTSLKSTSLLPYTGPGDGQQPYPQMPYEAISKREYNRRMAAIRCWPHELAAVLEEERKREYEIVDQQDCAGGVCPIR
jgi:ribonucleoside-triphosphate reductase